MSAPAFWRRWLPNQGPTPPRQSGEAGSERHSSQGFSTLADLLDERRQVRILDLGAANSENLDWFSPYAARLQVADLAQILPPSEPFALERFFEQLDTELGSVDLLLAWDLFNYLDRKGMETLANAVRALTAPRGLVFAQLYNRERMPPRPVRFHIADRRTLIYDTPAGPQRPCPRHPPGRLGQVLRGFQPVRSYLLKHGVEEYLFERSGG